MPLNKQQLLQENNTNFPNNNSQLITPQLLREFNADMIDAMQLTQSMSEYALLNGGNTFTGNQTMTGNLNVIGVISASVLHVQTETASVIYSSGSNQFGDALNDTQILSGSVFIVGSGSLNGQRILTSADTGSFTFNTGSLVTTASFNQYTQSTDLRLNSLETNSGSVNVSITNLNSTTASLITSVTGLNQFTQSQQLLNGTFATTGSNTFTGNQIIDRASKLYTNGIYWTDVTAGFNNLEIINQGGGNLDFASLNGGKVRIVNTPLVLTGSALTSSNDISTSANIYAANLITQTDLTNLSASLTVTDEFLQSQIDALDPSGSAASLALLNDFTASQLTINAGYNTATQSLFTSASLALTTASVNGQNITFRKGDGSTFDILIPTASFFTSSISVSGSITISGSIENVDYIDFNTASVVPAWKSGRVFWDNTDGCLAVYNAEADITLQVGQEQWVRVRNNTGVSIVNGAVVRLVGAQGDNPLVVLAQSIQMSGSVADDNQVLGIATHTIETGTDGYVTTLGNVRGLNTNAYNEGDVLWVSSSAGLLTNVLPVAPYERIPVATVVKVGPGGSGIVYVAPIPPIDFGNLSSVEVSGTYTNQDVWIYEGNVWKHRNKGEIGLTTTSSFNAYTQSTDSRLTNIELTTASLNSSVSQLNVSSASQQISIDNLNTTTASLNTSISNLNTSASLALVTASFDNGTRNLTFTKGDNQTFSVNIPDVSGSTGNFATTGSNTFVGDQNISGSIVFPNGAQIRGNAGQQTLITSSTNLTIAGDTSIAINSTNGLNLSGSNIFLQNLRYPNFDGTPGQVISTDGAGVLTFTSTGIINTGSFATTGSNTFVADQTVSASILVTGNVEMNKDINAGIFFPMDGGRSVRIQKQVGINRLSWVAEDNAKLLYLDLDTDEFFVSGGFKAGLQQGYAWVGQADGYSAPVATSSFATTINTGSFATTGSNNFFGAQRIANPLDTNLTVGTILASHSGSLILTNNSYPTASYAYISSSTNNQTNLIFQQNNVAADTTISGSFNIMAMPATPTAGFKRFVTTGNIAMAGANVPQISASMAFSPVISQNYFGGNGTTVTVRGPVSSSAYQITSNNILGQINIGTSAVNNATGLSSGLILSQNYVAGALNVVANQSSISSSTLVSSNSINGTTTLVFSSSAATISNNVINDSGFSFVNQFSSGAVGVGQPQMLVNTVGGANNTFIVTGSQLGAGFAPGFNQNIVVGTLNTLFVNASTARVSGANIYHNAFANSILGNRLIVSGSSNNIDLNSYGSTFIGRWNANDGIRNKTSDVIFAVGTGISGSGNTGRKTGFLIDSGSNTFVEGSLNVIGTTTMTGSLILSSSNAVELQVIGGSEFTGSLGIGGTTSLNGNLNVSGTTSLNGNIDITGSINVNSSSFIGQAITNITPVSSSLSPILNIVTMTTAEYGLITPNSQTLYVLV